MSSGRSSRLGTTVPPLEDPDTWFRRQRAALHAADTQPANFPSVKLSDKPQHDLIYTPSPSAHQPPSDSDEEAEDKPIDTTGSLFSKPADQSSEPHEQPDNPGDDPNDPPTFTDPEDDEDMSKIQVAKTFEGITRLEPTGSNFAIFIHRIAQAAQSLGPEYVKIMLKALGSLPEAKLRDKEASFLGQVSQTCRHQRIGHTVKEIEVEIDETVQAAKCDHNPEIRSSWRWDGCTRTLKFKHAGWQCFLDDRRWWCASWGCRWAWITLAYVRLACVGYGY